MRTHTLLVAVFALALLPRGVAAEDAMTAPVGSAGSKAEHQAARPYLANGTPDTGMVVGPPPAPGSAAMAADAEIYWSTRALQGSPRWMLATRDAVASTSALVNDFSCAFGRRLEPTSVPRLSGMIERIRIDASRATRLGKDAYRRVRPLVGNSAPICVEREGRLDSDPSYPSGHSTLGWTLALVLASAVPEHASAILARGRVFGESRIVCGVHWRSDVEAGRTSAASLVAALTANEAFRADLDAVRAELAGALQAASAEPDADACRLEAEAAKAGVP